MKFALRVLILRLIWKFLQNYFQWKKTQLSIIKKRSTQIPKERGTQSMWVEGASQRERSLGKTLWGPMSASPLQQPCCANDCHLSADGEAKGIWPNDRGQGGQSC